MSARYVMSGPDPAILDSLGLPEFGFVGRSNVGKSSLVGALLRSPKLVRTSRTPGRTQSLNMFVCDERQVFVDLPGYGFAKVSKTSRATMAKMIAAYVERRDALRGIVLILDARRAEVSELDREMAAQVLQAGVPLLLAISKADLIPKNRLLGRIREIEASLGVPPGCSVACSAKTGAGVAHLRKRLAELDS